MSEKLNDIKVGTLKEFDSKYNPMGKAHEALTQYSGFQVSAGTRRFLITSAQSATPVDSNFWAVLLNAQRYYKAHLSVIPYRYKNPTSRWTGSQQGREYWVDTVRPYLCNLRRNINSNLVVLGDTKIVPTAKDPLQGFEGHTGAESTIIGHPNLAFKTVAAPGHLMPKLMTTTGSCTVTNYTDSRAGRDGLHNHTMGAIIVEVEGNKFWLRHLNAHKDGSFTDLDVLFKPDGIEDAPRPEALVTGDTHVRVVDKSVDAATYGPKGIVEVLKPKRLFWHDVFDGMACNHHDEKRPFVALAKQKSGLDDVEKEVKDTIDFVEARTTEGTESVIVDSNHNRFLMDWIENHSWQSVGTNANFYLKTALMIEESTHTKDNVAKYNSPFNYWVNQRKNPKIRCLVEDESYQVEGIECGMHGHLGRNGSRGSLANLVTIGVKFIIGHVHGPGIKFGGMAVGLSAILRQGYNKGPSNWLQTHALIHKGGKRQLITIISGRWRM